MTGKERIHAALEGKPVDRMPVTALYNQLYHLDHFEELTGRPQPWLSQWLHASPEEHFDTYRMIVEKAPFEILQPQGAPPREVRENVEIVEKDGELFRHDKKSDTCTRIDGSTRSGHATDDYANETQYVFDKKDAAEKVKITKAEALIASGVYDYVEAAVANLGRDHFVLAGGVVGMLYPCSNYVGLTNLFAMLIEQPDLVEYMCRRMLENNIEIIRAMASSGADGIYIDDAMATNDMISVAHYERFCLPYMKEMVREVQSLGRKAIIIYFGGIDDRLQQIASIGADGLSMETSMKGYVNDIGEVARSIGNRVSLFGNIDPVNMLQNGTDAQLEAAMKLQAKAGATARGFIMCTGSPITPGTRLERVRRFIELGQNMK